MSESAINRRKSQLFLTQISPVYDTHDEVVRKKLKRGKFPLTKTGIIRMISLCLYLGSTLTWILLNQQCDNSNISYANISCIGIAFAGGLILFLLFSLGLSVKDPGSWIQSDIIFNLIISLAVIVVSILALKNCREAGTKHLSSALAISAASASICSCAALLLMYRFIEDTNPTTSKPTRRDPRKSIFA
ncbi:unnamed protein product [Ceutorhynchus assimilis]|uniref:MARVEL domain-containing protein n=1 Tax=Ceutorhynchus assimilis TaxID=467358 RepID=A0A9N9MKW9_9CUCU|nr:unnamed protein product [Ceutorhynchus assimilis]